MFWVTISLRHEFTQDAVLTYQRINVPTEAVTRDFTDAAASVELFV